MSVSNNGVGPGFIRALGTLGYRGLSVADLVRLRSHGLRADRVRELNERAGRRLSVDELVSERAHGRSTAAPPRTTPLYGLPVEYGRELYAAGYKGLAGGQLLEMRRAGVTASFIRSMREEGRGDLSPEALVELSRERSRRRSPRGG